MFFVILFGIGMITEFLYKDDSDIIEWLVMRVGIGLALYPILYYLGTFIGLVKGPVIYGCIISAMILLLAIARIIKRKQKTPITFNWKNLIPLIFAGVAIFMFVSGAFSYPWFEDSDPWEYSEAAKYIAETGEVESDTYFNHFAFPYPQGYQIVMAMGYGLHGNIFNSMKLFHNILIGLAVIFFYFMMKRMTKNDNAAIYSSIILFAIPSFFSHFIFSLTFNVTLMFIFFYACIRKWRGVAGLIFASILITHFYTAVIISVMFGLFILSRMIFSKKVETHLLEIGIIGTVLSLAFWVPAFIRYGAMLADGTIAAGKDVGGMEIFYPYAIYILIAIAISSLLVFTTRFWKPYVEKVLNMRRLIQVLYVVVSAIIVGVLIIPGKAAIKYVGGSASRVYTFGDFFFAKGQGLFNNPIGIGSAVCVILLLSLALFSYKYSKGYKPFKKSTFMLINWLAFCFIGVIGASLSIGFMPFRMWTFIAIPIAALSGIGLSMIKIKPKYIQVAFILIVLGLVIYTSFLPKWELNQSMWPEHKFYSPSAASVYYQESPANGKEPIAMIGLCHPIYVTSSLGYTINPWDVSGIIDIHKDGLNISNAQLKEKLIKYNITHFAIDSGCNRKQNYPIEYINERVMNMDASPNFEAIKITDEVVIFKVK